MSKTNNTQKAQAEIKQADFEELISNFAESEEILYYYNGDKEALKSFCLDTYGLNFRQTYNKLLAKAKIELRKKLLKVANNGDTHISKAQLSMLVWLSKAYLKLRENTPVSFNQNVEESNGDFRAIPKKEIGAVDLTYEDKEADF